MKVQITGKHMELGETLQTYCQEEVEKLVQKFHVAHTHCQILFEKETHHAQKIEVELALHLSHNVSLRSRAQGDHAHTCFDAALVRASEQLVRHKNRVDDHQKHHDNHAYKKLSEIEEERMEETNEA